MALITCMPEARRWSRTQAKQEGEEREALEMDDNLKHEDQIAATTKHLQVNSSTSTTSSQPVMNVNSSTLSSSDSMRPLKASVAHFLPFSLGRVHGHEQLQLDNMDQDSLGLLDQLEMLGLVLDLILSDN